MSQAANALERMKHKVGRAQSLRRTCASCKNRLLNVHYNSTRKHAALVGIVKKDKTLSQLQSYGSDQTLTVGKA